MGQIGSQCLLSVLKCYMRRHLTSHAEDCHLYLNDCSVRYTWGSNTDGSSCLWLFDTEIRIQHVVVAGWRNKGDTNLGSEHKLILNFPKTHFIRLPYFSRSTKQIALSASDFVTFWLGFVSIWLILNPAKTAGWQQLCQVVDGVMEEKWPSFGSSNDCGIRNKSKKYFLRLMKHYNNWSQCLFLIIKKIHYVFGLYFIFKQFIEGEIVNWVVPRFGCARSREVYAILGRITTLGITAAQTFQLFYDERHAFPNLRLVVCVVVDMFGLAYFTTGSVCLLLLTWLYT